MMTSTIESERMDDGYELSREFALQRFQSQVMKIDDLYSVQCLAVKLYAQVLSQRQIYESLLNDALSLSD